jgi:hypothetical protein
VIDTIEIGVVANIGRGQIGPEKRTHQTSPLVFSLCRSTDDLGRNYAHTLEFFQGRNSQQNLQICPPVGVLDCESVLLATFSNPTQSYHRAQVEPHSLPPIQNHQPDATDSHTASRRAGLRSPRGRRAQNLVLEVGALS